MITEKITLFINTPALIALTEAIQEKLKEVEGKLENCITEDKQEELKNLQAELSDLVKALSTFLKDRGVSLVSR